jgi:hypothetical protein
MTKQSQSTGGKAPSHIAYQVRDRDGEASIFTRIGAAWPHKDSKGFNIQLDAVPLDGRVTLRVLADPKA